MTAEQSQWLDRATKVIVWADRDTNGAGRDHARKVIDSLLFNGVVGRVVEAHEGKDAYDHLAAGYEVGEARGVILGDRPDHKVEGTGAGAETQTQLPRAALTLLGTYLHRAQTETQPRNETGFHLACQLRNHRISGDCVAYALADPTLTGVWGASTEAQRRNRRHQLRQAG